MIKDNPRKKPIEKAQVEKKSEYYTLMTQIFAFLVIALSLAGPILDKLGLAGGNLPINVPLILVGAFFVINTYPFQRHYNYAYITQWLLVGAVVFFGWPFLQESREVLKDGGVLVLVGRFYLMAYPAFSIFYLAQPELIKQFFQK